jgi:hypothetical protein
VFDAGARRTVYCLVMVNALSRLLSLRLISLALPGLPGASAE